jgi:hypothetical protein
VRQGPEETGEGGRWSSLREGSSNGGGLDSRWGGDDVGGQSGQEARRREGGSVALEEGRGWGERMKRGCSVGRQLLPAWWVAG